MTAWTPGWDAFPPALLDFWTERHLVVLSSLRPDGRPHAVPVGVALDVEQRCAWAISSDATRKVRNLEAPGDAGPARVAACQVDGARWSTLEGTAVVLRDEASVARACERYASRYRVPRPNPARVAVRFEVDRFVASRSLLD